MNQICTYSKYMDQADLGQAQDIHSSALRDAFIKKKKKLVSWNNGFGPKKLSNDMVGNFCTTFIN